MDWIFDHFQIVVLILLGIGSMVKSIFDSKSKQASEREIESDEPPEVPLDEDTSYRKTHPSVPPPLVRSSGPPPLARQVVPPPLRESGYEAAVAQETARALKHQQELAEHLRQIRRTKATTSGGAAATRARLSTKSAAKMAGKDAAKPSAQAPLSIRNRLRSPAEVRRAFVMREILDPPVGLR